MARSRNNGKSGLSWRNPYVKYTIYGLLAYYAYGYWMQSQTPVLSPIVPQAALPEPTVSGVGYYV